MITGPAMRTIDSTDGTFSRLSLGMVHLVSAMLNIDATEDGFVVFFTSDVGPTYQFALHGRGQNFFTAYTSPDSGFSLRTFNSDGVEADIIARVNQVRVFALPEPKTYALMIVGLAAIGLIVRRRKTRR